MSPILEILNNIEIPNFPNNLMDDINYMDDIFIYPLMRTKKLFCKYCNKLHSDRVPTDILRYYMINSIICYTCKNNIISQYENFHNQFIYKKIIRLKWIKVFEQIREIGMNPTRILQTQFFDNTIWNLL